MTTSRLRELIRAGVPDPFACPEGGKKQAAPDYTGAAEKQAASSKEALASQTWANRPTQTTPWGSTSWNTGSTTDPGTGQQVTTWEQKETLDPKLQAALDDQLAIQQGRSGAAGTLLGQATGSFQQPFNWGGMTQLAGAPQGQQVSAEQLQRGLSPTGQQTSVPMTGQQTGVQDYQLDTSAPTQTTQASNEPGFVGERQRIENALFERMQPEHARQDEASRARLANMGMSMGSQGYNRELERLHGNQAGERFNALQTAGSEQQRLNQMLLANQGQAFGQDVQSQQAQNAALGQQFGQGLQGGQFTNQALMNQFQQGLQGGQFTNEALQRQFGQEQQAAEFGNQAAGQAFNQNLAASGQNFNQQMQSANYQNQLRQQQIAEEAQRRNMPLNELNALLTGQQVGQVQTPNFNASGKADATNYLGAAEAQGKYGQDSGGSDWGTLLGTGAKIAGAAGMFTSDRRLKKDIVPLGRGWYAFSYLWDNLLHFGVMAQEVLAWKPEAVGMDARGYLMVDYSRL